MQISKKFKLHKACDQDKQNLRPALKTVHFDGTNLVATDGHILAVIKPKVDKNEKPGNIPARAFQDAQKIGTKKTDNLITIVNNHVEITDKSQNNKQSYELSTEKFPAGCRIGY